MAKAPDERVDVDERTDAELVRAASRGDEAAFESLYRRHARFVFAVARRFAGAQLAPDVAQETFGWLLAKLPTLALRGRLSTLLYPVIVHTAAAQRRRAHRGSAEPELVFELLQAPASSPEAQAERDDAGEDLRAALASLPRAQAEVVVMRFTDEMSLEEIAQALAIPLGTVKSRLHHALAALREHPRTRRWHAE
jgi:RNA polymerase sigma-70 factor (ECF subfamily)